MLSLVMSESELPVSDRHRLASTAAKARLGSASAGNAAGPPAESTSTTTRGPIATPIIPVAPTSATASCPPEPAALSRAAAEAAGWKAAEPIPPRTRDPTRIGSVGAMASVPSSPADSARPAAASLTRPNRSARRPRIGWVSDAATNSTATRAAIAVTLSPKRCCSVGSKAVMLPVRTSRVR